MEQSLKEAEAVATKESVAEIPKKRKEVTEEVTKVVEQEAVPKKQKREEKIDPNRPPPDCVLRVILMFS
jgi:hypothetical protein